MKKLLPNFSFGKLHRHLAPLLVVFGLLFANTALAQCPDDNVQFGTTTPACAGVANPVTATTCLFGGEYRAFEAVAGTEYTFATCGDTDFDTQLTVYSAGGAVLGFNDDFCGLQSSVTLTAPATETIRILIDEFNCLSNTTCMTLTYACQIGDAPVVTCPADITTTASPNTCGAVVAFNALATDTEDGVITPVQTMGPLSGTEFPVGTSLVEFTATDSDGNMSTCTFNVTVTDDEDPTAVCQDITVQLDASGNYTLLPGEIDGGSTDACGIASLEIGMPGPPVPSSLTTSFASNNGFAGNMFEVVALNDITVNSFDVNNDDGTVDYEVYMKPGTYVGSETTAGDWTLVGTATGVAGAGTDNPTPLGLTMGIVIPAGDMMSFYVTQTNGTGHNYINGTTAGNLWASDANVQINEGAGKGTPIFTGGTFSPRNFSGNIVYEGPGPDVGGPSLSLDCSNVGTNNVNLLVTDDAGNQSTCVAVVTVEDVTAPEIFCLGEPADFSILEEFEGSSLPSGWSTVITGGVQDWTFGSPAMPGAGDFPTNAAIFDDDAAGNTGENHVASLLSPIYDTSTAIVADLSFDYALGDFAGNGLLRVEVWDGAAWQEIFLVDGADTDPTPSGVLDMLPYANSAFQVRFTYDDEDSGWNWGAGVDNFLFEYNLPPSAPLVVDLDANGMATVSVADFLMGVNEACGWTATTVGAGGTPSSLTTLFDGGNGFNGNMFDINALNDVEIDGFDVHLAAGTTDDIEVYFKTGTYVGFETDASAWTLLGTAAGITSAGDNTPTPTGLDLNQAVAAGETVAFYVTTVNGGTMAYTNGTVVGAVLASDANIEILEGAGGGYPFNVTFSPRVFNGNINYEVSTPVDVTEIDFDCSHLGSNEFVVTVTDDSGNASTCTATVEVRDVTDPILICMDVTIELGPDGTAEVDPAALLAVAPSTFDAMVIGSDNQSGTAGTTDFTVDVTAAETVSFDWMYTSNDDPGFDSFGYVLNGTYTQLTDNAIGNQMGSASVAVAPGDVFGFRSVTDDNGFGNNETLITNFLPGFDGQFEPANWTVTLDNSDGDAFFIEIPGGPLSFDACGITVLAVDVTDVSCADIGTPITAMVFASDASGNIAACNSIITVVDALAPEVTCPADQTIDPGPGNLFYEVPDYFATGEATAIDNCTDPLTILSQSPAAGDLIPDGVYTVTITAEDEYGNVGECTFELTIESVLGLDDNVLDSSITMFPNPANASVTLSNTSNIALEKAAIYDTNGRLINTIDLSTMQQEKVIDVSALATGVYMVQIQSENASTVKRLVKE